MEKTVWAGALALALPLVGVAEEADDGPPVKTLGVVTVTGAAADLAADADPDHDRERDARADRAHRQRQRQRRRAQVLPEPAGAQALHRRLQPRDPVEPRLGHRQQRALGGLCRRHPAVELPRQRRRRAVVSAALGAGDAGGDRARRRHVRPVLGRVSGQLGRRRGRLRHPHADAASRRTSRSATSSSRSSSTAPTTPIAPGRPAPRSVPRRRPRLVDQRQPHRQRRPAADLRDRGWSAPGTPGTRRRAGHAAPCPASTPPTSPGGCSATARSTTPRQDHLKLKLAYDLTPTVRATYVLRPAGTTSSAGDAEHLPARRQRRAGLQRPDQHRRPQLHARRGGDFAATREDLTHLMHGLSIKSHTQRRAGTGSSPPACYDYQRDDKRQNAAANPRPGARERRRRHPGRRQRHRLEHAGREGHLATGGAQAASTSSSSACSSDRYQLRYSGPRHRRQLPAGRAGQRWSARWAARPRLRSLWAQDLWRFAPGWKRGARRPRRTTGRRTTADRVLGDQRPGLRDAAGELLLAEGGALLAVATATTVLKASVGRAVRMPDRGRALRRDLDHQLAVHQRSEPAPGALVDRRAQRRDATSPAALARAHPVRRADPGCALFADDLRRRGQPNVSRVQNIELIRTRGIEAGVQRQRRRHARPRPERAA